MSALPLMDISPDHLTADERHLIKRAARLEWAEQCAQEKDVLGWGKAIFPDKFTLPYCLPLHGDLVSIRGDEFTNREAPRNHAKTLIKCFLVPLFQGIYEPEEFRHYLNVQATGPKAQAVNVAMRYELETNDLLRELIGDQYNPERWTDMQFVLKSGVVYTAISAGQSIRGINHNNVRPDYIIVDDLYDEDDINNVESTQKKNAWFWGSLYPARAQTRRTSIHVQGTAINNYDLLEQLKKTSGVNSKTFKRVIDWDKGVVLWPEFGTIEHARRDMERMGSVIFFRECQNERRDETSAIIKRSWLYPTDGSPSWEYDPAELKFDRHHVLAAVIVPCDPSIGEKVQNDYTAAMLIYRARYDDGKGDIWYIHGAWNEHLTLDKRVQLLSDIAAQQPRDRAVTQIRIESIAGFKDFTAEVIRRTNLPVKEIDRVKDKISNLESKSHFFENKKVRINRTIDPKIKDQIVYQLTTNYPQHDDLRDAALIGLDSESGIWNFIS